MLLSGSSSLSVRSSSSTSMQLLSNANWRMLSPCLPTASAAAFVPTFNRLRSGRSTLGAPSVAHALPSGALMSGLGGLCARGLTQLSWESPRVSSTPPSRGLCPTSSSSAPASRGLCPASSSAPGSRGLCPASSSMAPTSWGLCPACSALAPELGAADPSPAGEESAAASPGLASVLSDTPTSAPAAAAGVPLGWVGSGAGPAGASSSSDEESAAGSALAEPIAG
mmetsp:Transcript_77814/g.207889  ORF Transcript_77814/g.207889 Transcript_77814/m.207889 type:complete len:225 (+) Transcript_77814:2427-3101(+)